MKNNSLKEIGQILKGAETILLFPHIMLDGDALGSSVALCQGLRQKGKTCYVMVEDKIPDNLVFLDEGYTSYDLNIVEKPDACICVDCGAKDRFPKRAELFEKGKTTICIDHHPTSMGIGEWNHIDGKAAATGELIYELLLEMDVRLTKSIGESLFAGISTDTGNFQYSNTTKKSHEIVTALYDTGMEPHKVSVSIYENETIGKIKLQSMVLQEAEIFAQGKGAISIISIDMLKECNATMEDGEGLVGKLRSIKGVEIAAIIKEQEDGKMKVTLRAKGNGDVSKIAVKYHGGGHVKAAGCTMEGPLEEVRETIKREIMEALWMESS